MAHRVIYLIASRVLHRARKFTAEVCRRTNRLNLVPAQPSSEVHRASSPRP